MENSSLILSQTTPIGVWGFGTSGQAITRFLLARGYRVGVYDQKPIAHPLAHEYLRYYEPDKLVPFLHDHQHIVPSPGIDLRLYGEHQTKYISELDVFYSAWQKKIIGITGTIGKTTVTHLLSQLIPAAGLTLATGGNIGIGMLDLVASQDQASAALLELSSFQLEGAQLRAPDLMIITNIYPNHLDRHGSQEAYTAAKLRPLALQTAHQQALVNLACREEVRKITHRPIAWFNTTWDETTAAKLAPDDRCFYNTSSGGLGLAERSKNSTQIDHHSIDATPSPTNSYPENWLAVRAALSLLNLPFSLEAAHSISIPEHRLACIATYNGINFYNDSKATIPEAMLAAVRKLNSNSLILFLGGVSKGVDRTPALRALTSYKPKLVICFGKEAPELAAACSTANIPALATATLEEGFTYCMQHVAREGDDVLFSPSGASFDLFSNYETRGERFKELVQSLLIS